MNWTTDPSWGGPVTTADELRACFVRHRPRLRAMVAFRLGPKLAARVDPSDVLQEAFVDAAERLDSYRANPALPPFLWLRTLTAQRLDEHFRRHLGTAKRAVAREVSLADLADTSAELAEHLASSRTPPPDDAARAELQGVIAAALGALDEPDRRVLLLRHFEQLTTAEVAAELGTTAAAAAKRYLRSLMKLRAALSRFPGLLDGFAD